MPKIMLFGKEINYVPYQSAMYLAKMYPRIQQNESFKRVFKVNLTEKFLQEHKDIINPNIQHIQNTIWAVYGETGSGKSIVTISLVKYILQNTGRFSHENVCFMNGEILKLKEVVPQNSFIIRDENPMKAVFGVGSVRQSAEIDTVAESCRKYGLSLVFIEPEFKKYDIAKYYLETVDMDDVNRITRVAVLDPTTHTYLGALYVPILPDDDPDWVQYNQKKDKFIKQVLKGDYRGSKTDLRHVAVKLKPKLDKLDKKHEQLAFLNARFPNFTNQEIKDILSYVNIIEKYGKEFLFDEDGDQEE